MNSKIQNPKSKIQNPKCGDPQSEALRILILEDVSTDAELVKRELLREGIAFTSMWVDTREAFLEQLVDFSPDIILSDYSMPQFTGREALELVKERHPSIPVIMVTGSINEHTAVECMKAGAIDYVIKENLIRLGQAVLRALEEKKLKEQKEKAEKAVRESEKKYRTLIENASEAIIVAQDGVFKFANPRGEELYGRSKEELASKPFTYFIHEEDREIVGIRHERRLKGEEIPDTYSFRIIDKNGDIKWVELKAALFSWEGKPATLCFMTDITKRKQADEEREMLYDELKSLNLELEEKVKKRTRELELAVREAEEANSAKSNFLANMSHELRTPLNAVIGFSEVLRDQYFGKLNEKQADYVNDILESGKHLLSLINDILDLSKIEAGKVEFEPSKVNIKELLEDSLIMVKEKCMKHGIGLGINITQDLKDLEITADKRRLKQVMFNLLSNAAKFTPDGGKIRVTADLISEFGVQISELKEEEKQSAIQNPKSKIEVCIADTGIGISPKDLEKIFNEFYQVKGGIRDKTPGTGLGLSLTRRLVEMHGGKIWVESDGEEKGSRFSFTLPVKI